MSEDMLSKTLVRELPGLMRDFLKKVLGKNGQEWIEAFKIFLKKQNPWSDKFLNIEKFHAVDYFCLTPEDQRATAELLICFIGKTFMNAFLLNGGEVKTDSKFRPYHIKDKETAGTTLAELYTSMKAQGWGQVGILATNGWSNTFYIRNATGMLCMVYCAWDTARKGWHVDAYSDTNLGDDDS